MTGPIPRLVQLSLACLGLALFAPRRLVAQTPVDTLHCQPTGGQPAPASGDSVTIEARPHPPCAPETGLARVIEREEADLPVDRIVDLLALEPGVGSLGRGDLSIRGGGAGAVGTYLDGVPITPRHRGFRAALLGGSWFGEAGTGAGIGTNAFEQVTLTRGVSPAEFATARGGIVGVTGRDPEATGERLGARQLRLRGAWATDAMLGASNGLGFNRITVEALGRTGPLAASLAAVFEGQSTALLGMEQNASPVYLSAGVDTTLSFSTPGGPRSVDVLRFTPSDGIRIPSSAISSYSIMARAGYRLGPRHRVRITVLASQRQAREFDYENLYNPAQLRADRGWSRVLIGSWFGTLREGPGLGLTAEAHLSWQTDRATNGPLTVESERASRSPFAGMLLGPLRFQFDGNSFPVDRELVRNFRTNSGRRSPYDLSNTARYSLIDEFRNNAYGLAGFSESGGPVGLLRLSQEDRVILKAAVEARMAGMHRLRVGVESEHDDLAFYASQLTSQLESEAYRGTPSRLGVFADYDISGRDVTVGASMRLDRFTSGATRPVFPRISSAPGFDPANPTAGFVRDRAHQRVSPSLRAAFQAAPGVRVSGAAGTIGQMPDLAQAYAGVNTDLSITNASNQTYGSDLGFERVSFAELSGQFDWDNGIRLEGTAWSRSDADLVVPEIVNEFDPFRQEDAAIRRYRNGGGGSAKGLDLKASRRFQGKGQAWLGYGFADADVQLPTVGSIDVQLNPPRADVRRHTVVGAGWYEVGPENRALGGVLKNTGIYGTFRATSGTLYTRCALGSGNRPMLSDGFCVLNSAVGKVNGSSLPWTKLVDLKLTRGFHAGAAELVAFVDVRNLLNSRNVVRVFVQTGRTDNPILVNDIRSGDLDQFAVEASQNGVLAGDGTINLSFGGVSDPRTACGNWAAAGGTPAPPNCLYLLAAEERFGNGDHRFTLEEQTRASDGHYDVAWGEQRFTGSGRRVRLGLELRF